MSELNTKNVLQDVTNGYCEGWSSSWLWDHCRVVRVWILKTKGLFSTRVKQKVKRGINLQSISLEDVFSAGSHLQ